MTQDSGPIHDEEPLTAKGVSPIVTGEFRAESQTTNVTGFFDQGVIKVLIIVCDDRPVDVLHALQSAGHTLPADDSTMVACQEWEATAALPQDSGRSTPARCSTSTKEALAVRGDQPKTVLGKVGRRAVAA